MRSYSHLLYRVEDSVVNNKAIQTYSAWWPECQHVTGPWRPGTGTGGSAGQRPHIVMVKQKLNKELEKSLNIAAVLCQTQSKQSYYLLKIKCSFWHKMIKNTPSVNLLTLSEVIWL